MAVGARGRDILVQFLIESVTLSAIGGLIGIGLGFGASKIVAEATGWPTLTPLWWVLVASLTSAIVGVVSGFYPAWKASKLDPIEALRYELFSLVMNAEVLSTHTAALFHAAVQRAAQSLREGGVVALPTETVYGLAANAFDAEAVAKIYEIKGRPAHNPIILHVASVDMARRCVTHWPESASVLANSFWPGPLTMVLPKADEIPGIVTAGGDTVGLRWPSHPFIQAVIRECGFPIAAPSANLSNQISPTNAEHVRRSLGDKLAFIVDGGQSQVGIESTVVDLVSQPPRVLRPGMIHEESLLAVIGEVQGTISKGQSSGEALRSPGLLRRHYSPKARLTLLSWREARDLDIQLSTFNTDRSKVHIIAHTHLPAGDGFAGVSVIPQDAEAFARAIYAELHRCDEAGVELIVVEALPDSIEWLLRRWRYVESNLVYDRGTLFGLETNGRIESILMSLPAVVNFDYNAPMETNNNERTLMDWLRNPRSWQ